MKKKMYILFLFFTFNLISINYCHSKNNNKKIKFLGQIKLEKNYETIVAILLFI